MADQQAQRVEIPIEISPQDSRDIKHLLEEIKQAEGRLFKIQQARDQIPDMGGPPQDVASPMSEESHTDIRKRRKFDSSELTEGRNPLGNGSQVEETEEGLGTIGTAGAFLLSRHEEALPKGKETPLGGALAAGTAPYQRNTAFQKLVERQNKLEEILSGRGIGGEEIVGGFSTVSSLIQNPTGFISNIIGKSVPIIAPILIAKGLMDYIIAELVKPGGVFDRRFEIKIEKQVNKLLDRQRQAQIRAGLTEVRATSARTLRGNRGSISTNLNLFKGGKPVYDETLENYSKGNYQ